MEVLAHPDPFVLENALLERISAAQSGDPFAPVLVVVPSTRLAEHVERRIAERHGARLNVSVLHYHALISRILAAEATRPYRTLSRRLREAMLEAVLEAHPEEPWSRFARQRPGALDGLMEAVKDLREAGLTAAQVGETLREGERESSLARIYSAYVETLDRVLEEHGLADNTLRAREAAAGAERFASGFRAVIHHGAYELIGRNLELLRALDRGTTVTFLLPAEPGAPASRYAERFARRFLLEPDGELGRVANAEGGLIGSRLVALYDEAAEPEPVDPARVAFRNAQGDRAEIAIATRRALGALDDDTPPWESAIVARSLSP
ncbi:MAG: hypothetical protein R3344_02525, partial [Acidobacteriota bacterium]|nr:hypothetical protein [Acidobacteriota bacterium]